MAPVLTVDCEWSIVRFIQVGKSIHQFLRGYSMRNTMMKQASGDCESEIILTWESAIALPEPPIVPRFEVPPSS